MCQILQFINDIFLQVIQVINVIVKYAPLLQFGAVATGVTLGLLQYHKTTEWNKKKAAKEACHEFTHSPTKESWDLIYEPIFKKHKKYNLLSEEQKRAAKEILFFFETLSITAKYEIVEQHMIYEYFAPYLFSFHNAMCVYIEERRETNKEEFETFIKFIADMKLSYNKTKGVIMNTGNVESSAFIKNNLFLASQDNKKMLIPTSVHIKGIMGKIDLSVVAASVCACGCSCSVDNE